MTGSKYCPSFNYLCGNRSHKSILIVDIVCIQFLQIGFSERDVSVSVNASILGCERSTDVPVEMS